MFISERDDASNSTLANRQPCKTTMETLAIIYDDRERDVAQFLPPCAIKKRLQFGDFMLVTPECIVRCYERKAFKDFVASIIDKRVFDQLKSMLAANDPSNVFVILEGPEFLYKDDIGKMTRASIDGAINFMDALGVHLLYTRGREHTASCIVSAFNRLRNGEVKLKKITPRHIDKDDSLFIETQCNVLTAFPGIGQDRAFAILKRFGSLHAFFSLTDEDLFIQEITSIRGISKKIASTIFRIIHNIDDDSMVDDSVPREVKRVCLIVKKALGGETNQEHPSDEV